MLVENKFPQDIRVRNEAICLNDCGYEVSVICLKGKRQRSFEKWKNISVYRIPEITVFKKKIIKKDAKKKIVLLNLFKPVMGYSVEYMYFTAISFILSLLILVKEGFQIIHAHNPPDILFLIGGFYRLLGKTFVFDQHDLAPDMYLAKYGYRNKFIYRLLLISEQLSCRLAHTVITTNESCKEITIKRNKISSAKIGIVRNAPDQEVFENKKCESQITYNNKLTLVYVGALNSQDGGIELINALIALIYHLNIRNFKCIVIGDGETLDQLKQYTHQSQLNDFILFTGWLSQDDVYKHIYASDICLSPEPLNEYNDNSSFIKIVEYMAFGKPIVAFDLKETRYTAQEAVLYARPNNELEFAKEIQRLMDNPELRTRMGAAGRKRVEEKLSWRHVSKNLVMKYEEITKRATCKR